MGRPRRRGVGAAGALSAAAGALLEDAETDALAYPGFPVERGRRIRADNVQERMDREMKRGPRVVQVFPSPESTLYLAGAVRAGRDEDWSSSWLSPRGPSPSRARRRAGEVL